MNEVPDNFDAISKPDIFTAFKDQIKKDFEMCALNSDFILSLDANYGMLLQTLAKEIEGIMKNYSTKLSELLYRIDISEQQVKKLSKEKADPHLADIVAELIIKRELQKVVLKEMYKK